MESDGVCSRLVFVIQHAIVAGLTNQQPKVKVVTDAKRIELIIKLSPVAARSGSPEYLALQDCLVEAGISISPLGKSAADQELATYFVAHVDPLRREHIIDQLLACPGVESAYTKPRGEPPR